MSNSNPEYTPLNALVYTSIQNNIPQNDARFSTLTTKLGFNSASAEVTASEINNILSETTIKRACCLANQNGDGWGKTSDDDTYFKIDVKIPTPSENFSYGPSQQAQTQKKFGYIDSTIYVPKNMCASVGIDLSTPNNNLGTCDSFYETYCENQKYFYNLENSAEYDADEFFYYTNYECPCFADYPPGFFNNPAAENGGGVCYLPNCNKNNGGQLVYFDPASRAVNDTCTANICSQINTVVAAEAMGHGTINISSDNSMKCGIQAPTKKTQSSKTISQQTTGTSTIQNQEDSQSSNYQNKNGDVSGGTTDTSKGSTTTGTTNINKQQNVSQDGTGTLPARVTNGQAGQNNITSSTPQPSTQQSASQSASQSTAQQSASQSTAPTPTPTPTTTTSSSSGGLTKKDWYIIGGVGGGLLLIIIIIVIVMAMRKKSRPA